MHSDTVDTDVLHVEEGVEESGGVQSGGYREGVHRGGAGARMSRLATSTHIGKVSYME